MSAVSHRVEIFCTAAKDAKCHERTNAPQQKSHHSIAVGTREQHGRRYGTTSTIFRSTS
jgi:hypothetical protein